LAAGLKQLDNHHSATAAGTRMSVDGGHFYTSSISAVSGFSPAMSMSRTLPMVSALAVPEQSPAEFADR
jgi:hypothetical protein